VILLQQISYMLEIRNLMKKQDVTASSSLKTLNPFFDKEGLLRLGERLQQSTLPYRTMHQMILPSNHQFTNLVFSTEQISLLYAGSISLRLDHHVAEP